MSYKFFTMSLLVCAVVVALVLTYLMTDTAHAEPMYCPQHLNCPSKSLYECEFSEPSTLPFTYANYRGDIKAHTIYDLISVDIYIVQNNRGECLYQQGPRSDNRILWNFRDIKPDKSQPNVWQFTSDGAVCAGYDTHACPMVP